MTDHQPLTAEETALFCANPLTAYPPNAHRLAATIDALRSQVEALTAERDRWKAEAEGISKAAGEEARDAARTIEAMTNQRSLHQFEIDALLQVDCQTPAPLSALEPQTAPMAVVPAGWVAVPVEPAHAMLLAGYNRIDWHRPPDDGRFDGPVYAGSTCREDMQDAWAAMLAAAPPPPLMTEAQAGAKALREVAGKLELRAKGQNLSFDGIMGMKLAAAIVVAEADRLDGGVK